MLDDFTIVIDAGHGGHDSGAVNAITGTKEKNVVLADSLLIGSMLEAAGMRVIQTRKNDMFRTLLERASIANAHNAPLISLHCNASNTEGTGFEAFTSPGDTGSDELATMMLQAYEKDVAEQHGLPARYDLRDGDPDKEARFTVLTKTKREAVLFELGFIDHPHDVKFLTSEKARQIRCRVLADAIIGWTHKKHGFVPRLMADDAVIDAWRMNLRTPEAMQEEIEELKRKLAEIRKVAAE